MSPEINVFGPQDRDEKGRIKTDYPGFYFDQNIDDLEETIRQRASVIEDTSIPKAEREIAKTRYTEEKTRLEQIQAARPNLSGEELDWINKCAKEAGKLLSDAMPTYSEMEKRLIDAYKISKIMDQPSIDISKDTDLVQWVRCLGKSPNHRGYISFTNLSICWKIARKLLDMPSNIEELRKDSRSYDRLNRLTRK